MARTALPLSTLTPNSALLNSAGTTIDAANGMFITYTSTGFPATGQCDSLVLYVQNTTASTKQVTVRAGTTTGGGVVQPGTAATYPNVPAFESGKGDLVTGNLTATTGTAFIGPFEVARFVQQDGTLNIDFTASMTGTIWAVQLPKRF